MVKRVAIYSRVSTDGQSTENQTRELHRVAELRGWQVVAEYVDRGISGAKGRDQRPQFDALWKDAIRRKFDVVAVWKMDRLGRSVRDLVNFSGDLEGVGVDLYLHDQAIDTSTAAGKLFFTVLSGIAEYERSLIQDRVKAGLSRAKAQGRTLGRPKVSPDQEQRILDARAEGLGIQRVAKRVGVGVSVVQRVLADAAVVPQEAIGRASA